MNKERFNIDFELENFFLADSSFWSISLYAGVHDLVVGMYRVQINLNALHCRTQWGQSQSQSMFNKLL